MHYEWLSIGDQDECTRKMCMLGPYKLEHIEHSWGPNDTMFMANYVWLWDPIQDKYIEVETNLELTPYKRNESFKVLEDWYAVNVLSEKLWTGESC